MLKLPPATRKALFDLEKNLQPSFDIKAVLLKPGDTLIPLIRFADDLISGIRCVVLGQQPQKYAPIWVPRTMIKKHCLRALTVERPLTCPDVYKYQSALLTDWGRGAAHREDVTDFQLL